MLLATSIDDVTPHEVPVTGQTYRLFGLVGAAPVRGIYVEGNEVNDNQLPQGFLVHQPPHSVTRPHFHETNQFQVFVGGDGRFGKKVVDSLAVQYANGHTPYGPIVAGPEGVHYFTLRQRWDPGAKYMPQMRDRLERGRQRQQLVVAADVTGGTDLEPGGQLQRTALIETESDGLGAELVRLPGGRSIGLDTRLGGGQYHVVIRGALRHRGTDLPPLSCQYASDEEGEVEVVAGAGGLTMLVLRFGRADRTPGPRHLGRSTGDA